MGTVPLIVRAERKFERRDTVVVLAVSIRRNLAKAYRSFCPFLRCLTRGPGLVSSVVGHRRQRIHSHLERNI